MKGTRTGTSTNIEGEFTLDVKSDKVALEVSFIGMKKQTVQVDATRQKMLEIILVDDVKTLEDVVVTGYSNVRKSSFTGSSTQISGDDLRKVSQTNVIGAHSHLIPLSAWLATYSLVLIRMHYLKCIFVVVPVLE